MIFRIAGCRASSRSLMMLALAASLLGPSALLGTPLTLTVATNGNDAWSGRLAEPKADGKDGPLRTVEAARDKIRALKAAKGLPDGGITVCVRGGVYELAETFTLTGKDSGSAKAPIVYRAHQDEAVRFVGGKAITGFKPVTDQAVLDRLMPGARGKVLQVDLKAQGIADYGTLKRRGFGCPGHAAAMELFFQDRPMTLARYPNDGWMTIKSAPKGAGGGQFTVDDDRLKRWTQAEEIWVHGYWTHPWADTYEKVASIDPETHAITTVPPHGVYGYKVGQRFYAHNLLEELDAPGEFFIDREKGVLYFWPPAPIDEHKAIVSMIYSLVRVQEAHHITLAGFTFECCRGTGVAIRGGSHVTVAGCTLRNTGGYGASMGGGSHHAVRSCDVYFTGDGGVGLRGGDRRTLINGDNLVENCHIHHFARWSRTYRPAVGLGGCGNKIRHNLIHNGPHAGIQGGGNEHLVEFNELYSICQETGDVGGFYIGRDWTQRGNVIRHNFFHHLHGPYTHGAMAVYLDDAASGATIYGNVFYKASRAAFIGGGRDNIVENNIMIDCKPSVHIDTRCLGWANKYAKAGGSWGMRDKLKAVSYQEPPYSTRYPKLVNILEDEPLVPKGNVVARNVSYDGRWLDAPPVAREHATFEDNVIVNKANVDERDPKFVDPERMDFRLRDDSPAYKLGFKKIPFEKIGLYKDAYRKTLPQPKRDWNDFVPIEERPEANTKGAAKRR